MSGMGFFVVMNTACDIIGMVLGAGTYEESDYLG
jgi:hypothetical protein